MFMTSAVIRLLLPKIGTKWEWPTVHIKKRCYLLWQWPLIFVKKIKYYAHS